MNTSEGNIVPSVSTDENIYGNPILQSPQEKLPIYAQQRYTPPPPDQEPDQEPEQELDQEPFHYQNVPQVGEREQIVIVTEVPERFQVQQREPQGPEPIYDVTLSIYVAACVAIFFPITGVIYIMMYLFCLRRNREISDREKHAFSMLCLLTLVSLLFEILFISLT